MICSRTLTVVSPQLVGPFAGSSLMVQKKRTLVVVSRPLQVTEVTPGWLGRRQWICKAKEDQHLQDLSSGVIRRASTGMGTTAQGLWSRRRLVPCLVPVEHSGRSGLRGRERGVNERVMEVA